MTGPAVACRSVLLALLCALSAIGCGGLQKTRVRPDSAIIEPGQTASFTLTRTSEAGISQELGQESYSYSWRSTDSSIATVDASTGVARGHSPGKVRIFTLSDYEELRVPLQEGATLRVTGASRRLGEQVGSLLADKGCSFETIMNAIGVVKEAARRRPIEIQAEGFERGVLAACTPSDGYQDFPGSLLRAALAREWFAMGEKHGKNLKNGTDTDESVALATSRALRSVDLASKWAFLHGLASGYGGRPGLKKARAIYVTIRPAL